MTLTIHKWSEIFENADTRKRERLAWFHAPSGNDSRGYLALVSRFPQAEAMMAFGIFQALCQLSATLGRSTRGSFRNSDGTPMDIQQIAVLLRIQECHLSAALEILTDQKVGWLRWEGDAENLPVPCQSSPGFVQGKGKGKGEGSKLKPSAGEDDDLEIIRRPDRQPETPPDGRPPLDEVKRYAASAPVPISVQCAIAFHDTQEMQGWITTQGHPIADWRAALRRYASRWNEHEKGRGPGPTRVPGGNPKPRPGSGYGESDTID